MRRIVVSIQNGLLAEGLTEMLRLSGEFEPYRVAVDQKKRTVPACMACSPDIVLMEVSQAGAHGRGRTAAPGGARVQDRVPV